MAHYALLDENNVVVQVITGRDEDEVVDGITDWEAHYSEVTGFVAKRTSYNTSMGKHKNGGTPFRVNYAGIGFTYDSVRDAFIANKPDEYPSWVLDETTLTWIPPLPRPDGDLLWNEASQTWDPITQ